MNIKCTCGAKMRRSDIIAAGLTPAGHQAYRDTDPKVAHWRCDRCGRTRTQRKRQPGRPKVGGMVGSP